MSRRGKATGKAAKAHRSKTSVNIEDFPFPEMVRANTLTQHERKMVSQLNNSICGKPVADVVDMAYEGVEEAMTAIGKEANIIWKQVRKRSNLHTALLYVLFKHLVSHIGDKFDTLRGLRQMFPEFESHPETEQWDLLKFSNAINLMSHFMPPKKNKQVYMEVSSRLASNFSRRFVTGGGQTAQTNDRVLVYERLGDVTKCKRDRKRAQKEVYAIDVSNDHRSTRSRRAARCAADSPSAGTAAVKQVKEEETVKEEEKAVKEETIEEKTLEECINQSGQPDQSEDERLELEPKPKRQRLNTISKSDSITDNESAVSVSPTTTLDQSQEQAISFYASSEDGDNLEIFISPTSLKRNVGVPMNIGHFTDADPFWDFLDF